MMNQMVRQNFEEKSAYFAQSLPGMTILERGHFLVVDCGLPSDTFNVVVVRDLTSTEQVLTEGVGYFMEKRWPTAVWYWEDAADKANMADLLAYGLKHNETDVAMVADLATVRTNAQMPTELVIQHAESPLEIQQFGVVLARSFGASEEGQQVAAYFDGLSHYPMSQYPKMRFYLGFYEGQAVATGTMFVGQETVGIYDIVTLAEYRRRGIGSAMFAHLLQEAQVCQRRYAILQSSPDGLGIYERAGFTAVGHVHVFENRALL